MNVVIAIVITAALSVLVGIYHGDERYKEGFKLGELKEKRKSLEIYENGYKAGKKKGKEEAAAATLQENQVIETVTYSNTVMLRRTETVTLDEEHETSRTREELINWHTNHLYERLLNDAKRAIDITVTEPNATGETEIEGRLVVVLRG